MKTLRNLLPILAVTLSFNAAFGFNESYYLAAQKAGTSNLSQQVITDDEAEQIQVILDEDLIAQNASAQEIARVNKRMKFNQKCSNFARDNDYGKWGNEAKYQLESGRYDELLQGTDDLLVSCPRYKQLPRAEQRDIWILILSAMAHYESSCNPNTKIRPGATAGRKLVGIWQLDLNFEHTYVRDAGCDPGDGKSPVKSVQCVLSMLQLQAKNRHQLFSKKSYWDVLRSGSKSMVYDPDNRNIMTNPATQVKKAIRNYTGCK